MGVCAGLPRGLPHLLLLLGVLATGGASLRLLEPWPANCSQEELNCTIKKSNCLDKSWYQLHSLTPSPPKDIQAQLDFMLTQHGDLEPLLRLTWTLKGDASVLSLKGAEVSVLQVNTNERLCVKFKFLSTVRPERARRLRFTFSHFVVEPNQKYMVMVQHLPKPGPDGEPNHLSTSFQVPGCADARIKKTVLCVKSGSLWEPNATAEVLEVKQLRVSFSPWKESARYQVLLQSFPRGHNESCFSHTLDVPAPTVESTSQQTQVTFNLPGITSCCHHRLQIQPFFSSCQNDCRRHPLTVPCPEPLPSTREQPADYIPLWAYGIITSVAILLVASIILITICMTLKMTGSQGGKSSEDSKLTDSQASPSPPPLKPQKVWLVYSADHPLYVEVVLKLAQFLLTVCGTRVALDLLEEQAISQAGAMSWLGRQKQEVAAGESKALILCSRGTRAKWRAMLDQAGGGLQLRCDSVRPAGDLFTASMNLILPDFRRPACFGAYIVCYFGGVSGEADVPELFHMLPRYALPERLEELYFRIQDLEMFAPGCMHRVGALSTEGYTRSPAGLQLQQAVERFKAWQDQCPDWFEHENLLSAQPETLSLQEEEELELEEPLLCPESGILRQEPLVREATSSDGCLALDLLAAEAVGGLSRLEPLPSGPQGTGALQATVLPADVVTPALAVEPIPAATEDDITSQLAVLDHSEACPPPQGPQRNSILFHLPAQTSEGPPPSNTSIPSGPLLELEDLMLSLFQKSLQGLTPGGLERPAGALKDRPLPSEEEQSDQGYISRSSPLPSDGQLDAEEEEAEGPGQQPQSLSPKDLENLRRLQQHLFLQGFQQPSGWGSPEPGELAARHPPTGPTC